MLLLDNISSAVAVYQSVMFAGLQAGVPAEALHHAASQGVQAEALRAAVRWCHYHVDVLGGGMLCLLGIYFLRSAAQIQPVVDVW